MGTIDELRRSSRLGLLVAITAASVGIIYGYDLSNIAGALLFITDEFGLTTHQQELVTTAVVIGEIVGAIIGGWLANAIGRKKSMVLVAASYAAFALMSALSVSVPMLLVSRLLLGLTIGVSVVVVPVYVAELAPAKVRGSLLVAYQVATVVGIIIGYLAAYLLAGTGSWRWMLGLAAVPAALVMLMLLRMPDTARWYMLKGRTAEARRALQQIEPAADVDWELAEIKRALTEESGGVIREMLRRAVSAGHHLRGRARLLHPDHRHQRDRLLQPPTVRGDGLPGQLRAARPAGSGPGRRAGGGFRLAGSG